MKLSGTLRWDQIDLKIGRIHIHRDVGVDTQYQFLGATCSYCGHRFRALGRQ